MSALPLPILMVNFKTYETGVGHHAVEMAKHIEAAQQQYGVSSSVCVDAADISHVAEAVSLPVLGQHADGMTYGAHTGHVLPSSLKEAGAIGTLLNHSEDPYEEGRLKEAIEQCKADGVMSVVCAPTASLAARYASFGPDMIAVEPPELIGKGVSVSTAQPKIVTDTIVAVHEVDALMPVLCGAGVVTGTDVREALRLGTAGVLLASGVLKAADVDMVLADLMSGFASGE